MVDLKKTAEELGRLIALRDNRNWETITEMSRTKLVEQGAWFIEAIDKLNLELNVIGTAGKSHDDVEARVRRTHELLVRVAKTLKGPANLISPDLWLEIARQVNV